MTKLLFIHGLASSGAYKMADTLRILLRPCEVLSPDFPIDPAEALAALEDICRKEDPDIVVGLSLGGFLAQKLRGRRKVLVNPDFHPSRLLATMVGENKYLSPRKDGALTFTIDRAICLGYKDLETTQFDNISKEEAAITAGMFATGDELVRCGDEFSLHYPGRRRDFPGGHLPPYPIVKEYIAPVIREMLKR